VSCVYRLINRKLGINETAAFFIVVALGDVMSLNFFYLVKDYGSWKDIGMSIGHFALGNFYILIQLLLFGVSQLLLTGALFKLHDE